jgi:hypothetical protein
MGGMLSLTYGFCHFKSPLTESHLGKVLCATTAAETLASAGNQSMLVAAVATVTGSNVLEGSSAQEHMGGVTWVAAIGNFDSA